MNYDISTCPICGAGNLKKIGMDEKDGQVFPKYKCPSCDAELSTYDKYLKALKKAAAATPKVEEKSKTEIKSAPEVQPQNRTAIVNIAADVYNKAISSTLALIAKMEDGAMSGTGTMVSEKGYFITNAHVVTELAKNHKTMLNFSEEVYGQSGEHNYRFVADLIYANPAIDLALLKTEPNKELVPVTFATQDAFPGEAVYAIGNSK